MSSITTYMDSYIENGQSEVLSLKHFYETILTSNGDLHSICRIPINDFFLEHAKELEEIVEIYVVPQSMYYQPKSVSLELYDTTELWLALLRLNHMRNIGEFCLPVIKTYNATSLKQLIDIFFKRSDMIQL